MKKAMVAVFACAALSVCAEIVERPDADTLWIENGKALSVADKPGILTWHVMQVWLRSCLLFRNDAPEYRLPVTSSRKTVCRARSFSTCPVACGHFPHRGIC